VVFDFLQLDDKYGSPMLEDIERFARAFYTEMECSMGEEAAGDITVEASSPVCIQAFFHSRRTSIINACAMKLAGGAAHAFSV
jgi:hypothetical protein